MSDLIPNPYNGLVDRYLQSVVPAAEGMRVALQYSCVRQRSEVEQRMYDIDTAPRFAEFVREVLRQTNVSVSGEFSANDSNEGSFSPSSIFSPDHYIHRFLRTALVWGRGYGGHPNWVIGEKRLETGRGGTTRLLLARVAIDAALAATKDNPGVYINEKNLPSHRMNFRAAVAALQLYAGGYNSSPFEQVDVRTDDFDRVREIQEASQLDGLYPEEIEAASRRLPFKLHERFTGTLRLRKRQEVFVRNRRKDVFEKGLDYVDAEPLDGITELQILDFDVIRKLSEIAANLRMADKFKAIIARRGPDAIRHEWQAGHLNGTTQAEAAPRKSRGIIPHFRPSYSNDKNR